MFLQWVSGASHGVRDLGPVYSVGIPWAVFEMSHREPISLNFKALSTDLGRLAEEKALATKTQLIEAQTELKCP